VVTALHGRAGEIHAKAAGALLPALLLQVCMHVASALCRHVLGRSFRDQSAAQKHKPGVLLLQRAGAAGAGASRPRRKLCTQLRRPGAGLTCLSIPAWLHSLASICPLDIDESSYS